MKKSLNFKKLIQASIVISLIQAVAIIIIIIYNFTIREKSHLQWGLEIGDFILMVAVLTVFTSSFITIKNLYSVSFITNEHGTMKSTLEQLESLNKTLRAQRHDFINHLQVVYSLMEMDENEEARNYIEKVYTDIQKINGVMKTSYPAINALLQAKLIFCEKKDIHMKINVTTSLESLAVPSWEFCRVIGNIIDNGIYALEGVAGNKFIQVEIFENMRSYCFIISNNGPKIPYAIIDKIFIEGFTTKGKSGQGMGLSISRDILTRYGGELKVISNDDITEFEGLIKK
jgi:two-component system, LytTR family, sensor histidine kinase AgrC